MRAAVWYPALFVTDGARLTSDSVQHKQFPHWGRLIGSFDVVGPLAFAEQLGRTSVLVDCGRFWGLPAPGTGKFATTRVVVATFWASLRILLRQRRDWDFVILFDPYWQNLIAYALCRSLRVPVALRMTGRHDLTVLEATRHRRWPVRALVSFYSRVIRAAESHAAAAGAIVTDGDIGFTRPENAARVAFCVESFLPASALGREPQYRSKAAKVLHIVSAARVVPWKGHHIAVEALARLRDQGIEARLDIIGPTYGRRYGDYEGQLRQAVRRLGLDASVTLHGWIADAGEFDRLWRSADVVVVPCTTDCDGVPKIVFEAMSYGIPVVASAVGGMPRVIRHGRDGLLVPPNDGSALAACLHKLAGDAELRGALSSAGFALARTCTVERLARRQVALLARAAFGHLPPALATRLGDWDEPPCGA